jgi:hypothetical protein
MYFEELSFSDKLAMLNLTTMLVSLKLISIPSDRCDEEEIVNFLIEQASYLLNKSDLFKKPKGS